MPQSTDKNFLYSGLKKYLMGRTSGYLNPGARRTLGKIVGCPTLKWDMTHADSNLHDVLQCMTALNEFWIRPLDDFDPKQFPYTSWLDAELFRHLFLQYEIPEFLDNQIRNILTHGYKKPLEKNCLAWMVILGQGGSLRKAARIIGWDLPKLFSHKLYEVPATGLTLEQGVSWALTLAAGGKPLDCRRQLELSSRTGLRVLLEPGRDHFKHFWINTTRWMTRNRLDLDYDSWTVIRRWLIHINTEVLQNRARFCWKGRTVKSVLAIAENYLERRKRTVNVGPWARKEWDWSEQVKGVGECTIVELITADELVDEGECMDHCVAIYALRCHDGRSAIFSLRIDEIHRLTIEWCMQENKVVQVYGYANREATDAELRVIDLWKNLAVKKGLNYG